MIKFFFFFLNSFFFILVVMSDIVIVVENMFYYITYDDKIGDENENDITRKLACRLIIRLSLTIIRKIDLFMDFQESNKMNLKLKFILEVFLGTIKTIFRFLKIFIENNSLNNTSIFIENSSTLIDTNKQQLMIPNIDENEFDLTSYGKLSDLLNDFIFQNSFDLLLEFQNLMSILLPNLGLNVINSVNKNKNDNGNYDDNRNNNNDGSDSDDDEKNVNKNKNKRNYKNKKKSKYNEKENHSSL